MYGQLAIFDELLSDLIVNLIKAEILAIELDEIAVKYFFEGVTEAMPQMLELSERYEHCSNKVIAYQSLMRDLQSDEMQAAALSLSTFS